MFVTVGPILGTTAVVKLTVVHTVEVSMPLESAHERDDLFAGALVATRRRALSGVAITASGVGRVNGTTSDVVLSDEMP
jgi:hypothetical protein